MKVRSAVIALAVIGSIGCSSDQPDFIPWVLDDLHGKQGFSLRVPEFEVAPGRESQNCYFVRVPDLGVGDDIWIDRVLTGINPGSHHVNVFRVKTIIDLHPDRGTPTMLGDYPATVIEGSDDYKNSPCWGSANWADWPLIANSQHANSGELTTDWNLPTDVAIRLRPGEMLMLQTHYVNAGDQTTKYGARVGINFYRRQATEPPVEMGSLFATQQNIRICASQPRVTYSGTCRFPGATTIAAANGHFHKRGTRFAISAWDGKSIDHPPAAAQFYESLYWNDPPMATSLAVPLPASSGIWWDCEYQWQRPVEFTCDDVNNKDPLHQGDCCYTFGGNTDVGEHCNVFLYYYPKVESDIFCL
ncbi:MAG: hypothetical protein E6J90_04155 [Deltaproteobacteria bacterium]|nr:MAG: hypothetical protein E6J91_09780 [Deltaproteobacteria bacterium]TMQ26570.1 MAG: hypothetical protein E6J90_04155 [Deltaproteobacteria bacterium]